MISDLAGTVQTFLEASGFDVKEGGERFAFVAQNPTVLIFVVQVEKEFDRAVRAVTNLLAPPFRSKKFGPKTMEMYCVFVSNEQIPLSRIEQCEQDLKVCRKVVLTNIGQVETRLSFLRPLEEVLPGPLDLSDLFWAATGKYLNTDEIAFLRTAEEVSIPAEELLRLMPQSP
jgi:hypothetical protein